MERASESTVFTDQADGLARTHPADVAFVDLCHRLHLIGGTEFQDAVIAGAFPRPGQDAQHGAIDR